MGRRGPSGISTWTVAAPVLALGAVLLVALAAGFPVADQALSGAAGFVLGGVFAHLATLPSRRRRFVAGLLVLASALAATGILAAFYSQVLPEPLREAWATFGRFAF